MHSTHKSLRRSFALGCLSAALMAGTVVSQHWQVSAASTPPSRLYVMFLPGMCGPSTGNQDCRGKNNAVPRARATFAVLIRELARAGVQYTPLFYSYRPGSTTTYSVADTRAALARSTDALQRQITAVRHRDPGAHIDLVGYSLGGLVATEWAVTDGRSPGTNTSRGVRRFVHSIVTFDSPLKGIQDRSLGPILQHLFGGAVWIDLQPDSATIRRIVALPSSWWQSKAHLHSAANRADILVPPREALLGERMLVTDRSCTRDLGFLASCHGAILQDASLNWYVACHWITTPTQCVPAPTATPIPTSTSTPTPTSPLVTVTPTLTPTTTASVPALPPPP